MPEGEFPKPDPKFTMTEAEKIAQQKAKHGAMAGAARRREAEAVAAEEASAMAPDSYAHLTAGMDEGQKQMFYQSMGIEAPPDERTAADLAPVVQEPLAQNAPYDPSRETLEEFDMRRRGKEAADSQRQVAPTRGAQPLPFAEDIPEFDEDDEISTMDTSGFSLGGQLLKAILDDMLK